MKDYLRQALHKQGIDELNEMQQTSSKVWNTHADVLLLAPTGSGKTLAYLLPLVESLDEKIHSVQAVVVSPTRELALQIDDVLKSLNVPFRSMSVYGGRPTMEEHRTMKGISPSIVVGTPGRLNDHLQKHNFEGKDVRYLVIDEYDKCMELGFQDEIQNLLRQLNSVRQRFLTSATQLPNVPLCEYGFQQLDFLDERRPEIAFRMVMSPIKDKLGALLQLLCRLGQEQTLVFCNHRESVERVGQFLKSNGVCCSVYHGGLEQDVREKALARFRNGSALVMVSTDLAARGLDIDGVDNVVHYHLPLKREDVVHRNGRTARYGKSGHVYYLLHDDDIQNNTVVDLSLCSIFPLRDVIATPASPKYVTMYIGKGKKDKVNKTDVLGLLCKKANLLPAEVGKIDVFDHHCFVAISAAKQRQVISCLQNERVKGVKTVFEIAK
ncbi:MAG: DEAD/DEAH box helicase [Bacteroidales bacterium]|nr:DEAD/DEAH box helicase [Bacteroidales bacterium]